MDFASWKQDKVRMIYFTGKEDSRKYGGGFLVHKDISQTGLCTDIRTQGKRGRQLQSVNSRNFLRPAGKLCELTHKMVRYLWNMLGICEICLKNFGEMSTNTSIKFTEHNKGQLTSLPEL